MDAPDPSEGTSKGGKAVPALLARRASGRAEVAAAADVVDDTTSDSSPATKMKQHERTLVFMRNQNGEGRLEVGGIMRAAAEYFDAGNSEKLNQPLFYT